MVALKEIQGGSHLTKMGGNSLMMALKAPAEAITKWTCTKALVGSG